MLRTIATTCVLGLLASPTAMAGQAATSYSSAQRSSPGTQTGRRLKRLLLRGNESARSVPTRKSAVLPDRGPASSTIVDGRSSQDSSTRTYICWRPTRLSMSRR
jgi:hypothetical protein